MNIEEIELKIDKISRIIIATDNDILLLLKKLYSTDYRLVDIFAIDFPEREKRIEIVYNLLDIVKNTRVYVKLCTSLDIVIPSSVDIFCSANWFEREIFDMYGVHFKNHPNLQRILTDYNFEGNPMLKDFPLTGYKEVRYDMLSKQVIYEDVNLSQDYRNFDFLTPWQGTEYIKKEDK